MNKKTSSVWWSGVVLALFGLLDSGFLFYKYVTASPINCLIFEGCNTVAKSSYSHVFGIPLPTFGLIFYGGILVLFLLYRKFWSTLIQKFLLLGGIIGIIFSIYFIYLQGFIIGAFCIYCVLSAFASMLLFCVTILLQSNNEIISLHARD